ncbi:MAG: tRNA uridine-5-carboxymethylaminomethyl(34) synthesis GTPase MnmE [Bacteroidetes bacterium]|nr:tRNA uridine-5-carboxymethylaminomethyl(34) synthesis GTPase MnmE [Bacteroidota bacterium]MBU1371348.1 tRNA uridine-5-carboxymethylaminomethyl(34) synthesis GTPase MnmE [Bacteroidota bacterium]MBU1485835.1 tRNA uridine-5-carboxymethylaminomethyl(34) synthesis GTPase MnmE [Bacteroidota bacterium]MBU1761085.1 tRNA uridine-5-carboxymethylaminomethyl(34) synthesis GTPase MnmE [Bacteroidota bacterium]MBU2046936.1 tRNA uridine-5-carboxymethylaminomethyl(34) synthesis GTPase MnmE [Bacteroidota bact
MNQHQEETIVALATPNGIGAIGVIRLSGPDAIKIINSVFKGKDLEKQDSHTIHFGTIRNGETVVDEVLVSLFIAPKSYTKENVVEISCHGSKYIIDTIIRLFIKQGARLAKPGEFTLRAFLNGGLDLSQAEAVADLIASNSKASHQLALQQMRGGYSNELKALRERLIHFASMIELELDFSEEDVEFANREELKKLILHIHQIVFKLIQSFDLGNVIKNGVPVVIAGKPNVGKSTLLNALLNEERAIVSEIAGTTRDTIEDEMNIKGINFRFIDTAGIRETQDIVEAKGVERTFEKIKSSAVVMYLFDPAETPASELQQILTDLKAVTAQNNSTLLVVSNKSDIHPLATQTDQIISISAKDKSNLHLLEDALLDAVNLNSLNSDEVIVSNIRHLEALKKADESLNRVLAGIDNPVTSDFLALDIKQALHYLGEIVGAVTTDDLLDNIFSKFCIGK